LLHTETRQANLSSPRLICKAFVMRNAMSDDSALHVRICKEKAAAAKDELERKRDSAVGDLAVKAVEQAIEAAASLEGLHFHTEPRRAHSERTKWAKRKIPEISGDLDELWGAYGALGYEGVDGERALKAVQAMEKVIKAIAKSTKLDLE
jgi:hypothetical protein